jgi:DNA-binding NtrC family response regulator
MSSTILCVDDDPDMLAAVVRVLRMSGHTVIAADSPRAALAVLEDKPIAVLVSDFEMPEMNGVELAVRAREIQPETVRIMLTGRTAVRAADASDRGRRRARAPS